jgi:long-chain acyl-CoA synthetase
LKLNRCKVKLKKLRNIIERKKMTAMSQNADRNLPPMNTGMPLPLERFYHWEKIQPSKICYTQPLGGGKIQEITWGEAGNQVRRMAAYLKSCGIKKGDHVAILSKNCAHWIMSDIAIWMAGGVSVPLYPTLTAETVQQIMEHSEPKAVFVGKLDGWEEMKSGIPEGVKCISYPLSPQNDYDTWNDIIANNEPMVDSPSGSHGDLATIIYTSGTTGMPKGVMHSFNSIASGASQAANIYEVVATDRFLSYLPLSHVAERMCVELVQLYQGTHVFFAESMDTFAKDLQRAQPTVFFAVPRIWAKFQSGVLAKMPEKKLKRAFMIPGLAGYIKQKIRTTLGLQDAKFCLSGAAPISQDLLAWYKVLGIEVLEVYGMTENMGYSHSTRSGRGKAGSVGQPNPNVEVVLGDDNEIFVRSPTSMLGYYKEPEKTRETLDADNFIHTGDVGVVDHDGGLRITGRIKEIFKTSKGKYVAPFPIETKLLVSSHVEQCCVAGNAMPQPIALLNLTEVDYAALKKGGSREEIQAAMEVLYDKVNQQLDPHEKLKTLVVTKEEWTVENGIMTPTLKIKRNVLEAQFDERMEGWYESKQKVQWEE